MVRMGYSQDEPGRGNVHRLVGSRRQVEEERLCAVHDRIGTRAVVARG
jgi:hypothetical protein